MITAREISEQRMKLAKEAGEILEKAHSEKRAMTGEENEKWTKIHADIEGLKGQFDTISKQEKLNAEMAELGEVRNEHGIGRETENAASKDKGSDLRKFLLNYSQTGVPRPVGEVRIETRALSDVTGSAGQYTVPQGFYAQIQTKLKSFAGPRNAPCNQFETVIGNDLPVPIGDDTANSGALLTENAQTASNVDPSFAQGLIHQYTFSSNVVLVPIPLLQDNGVDLEQWLADQLAIRIARAENPYLTTGTGTNQPYGILQGVTQNVTAPSSEYGAGLLDINYNNLVDTFHAVDPAYRADPTFSWMCHDTTFQQIKKIVDTSGRPLWEPVLTSSFRDSFTDQILGKPVNLNQAMDSFPTTSGQNKKVLLVGAMRYFFIRTVSNPMFLVLRERYADFFQIGFVYYQRMGSYNTVPSAFAYYQPF